MQEIIRIKDAVARMPDLRFVEPVNWSLSVGQHWAIVGANGSGKTLFSGYLTGRIPLKSGSIEFNSEKREDRPLYEKIRMVSFQSIYSLADYKNMYYQQRWNSTDEEQIPLVMELVSREIRETDENSVRKMFAMFGIEDLLEKRLILLSSGELRKFLIVKALLSVPQVIILDNPYIGLDSVSRDLLNDLFDRLVVQKQTQILLILSDPRDIPGMITHVLPVSDKKCGEGVVKSIFMADHSLQYRIFPNHPDCLVFPEKDSGSDYDIAVEMQNINIKYGSRTILKNLNWEVRKGEKWALLGPNGAGKSTLLSLICADNPQAYANSFSLFGRKRGSGESIWDIKKKIGYVSPEVHLYYPQDLSCADAVGSGFFDSVGLYRKCTEDQLCRAREWLKIFGIDHLHNTPFSKLSFGEQRLVILARAFVKNPEMLILDEPLHGLDVSNKQRALEIIERYCNSEKKTLIYVTHYANEIPVCIDHQMVLTKIC